jgi:transcriptional regulator
MKRRDLLSGLAVAGMKPEAQRRPLESMYIPKPHLVEDRKLLHDFMDEFPFADLVTSGPALRITHVPVFLDRDLGRYGGIYGHISRQNPQGKAFDSRQSGVIVFHGPHSYISPTWFSKTGGTPTWNFAVVHATGKLNPITDKKALHDMLARLIGKFEDREKSSYDFAKIPETYKYGLMGGLIGFEMEIELLEGKFKLGQQASPADQQSLLRNLQSASPGRSMYQFTADFYKRSKPSAE